MLIDSTEYFEEMERKMLALGIKKEDIGGYGGYLSIGLIQKDKPVEVLKYKNNVFKVLKIEEQQAEQQEFKATENEEINKMLGSRLVKTKACDHNLMSLNFSRFAFKKRQWCDMTVKARGLFVDKNSGEVKLRSFNKFFNYGEIDNITGKRALQNNLKFPVKLWLKENGYLGILSVIDNEFVFATKSVTSSDYVDWFKVLFYQLAKDELNNIKQYIIENNCSLVFEVVSKNDPHIIEYEKEGLYLLEAIKNQLNYEVADNKEQLLNLIDNTQIEYKALINIINNWETLQEFFNLANTREIEGYVIEDDNGFMFKYKGKYYSDWKHRRGLVDLFRKQYPNKFTFAVCKDNVDVSFMTWLSNQPYEQTLNKSIIELRNLYTKSLNQ